MRVSPRLTPAGQLVPQQFYSRGFSDRLALAAKPAWCILFVSLSQPFETQSPVTDDVHRLVSGCIRVAWTIPLDAVGDVSLHTFCIFFTSDRERRTCATPQGHGHLFLIALLCNLCHIAGALEVGRRPGPSVMMNSFLLSLSFCGYLSPSLSVSSTSARAKWRSAKSWICIKSCAMLLSK